MQTPSVAGRRNLFSSVEHYWCSNRRTLSSIFLYQPPPVKLPLSSPCLYRASSRTDVNGFFFLGLTVKLRSSAFICSLLPCACKGLFSFWNLDWHAITKYLVLPFLMVGDGVLGELRGNLVAGGIAPLPYQRRVAILLVNKALAFITSSRHTSIGSAGKWRCPHRGCFAVPTDVWTLRSKPEEGFACLPSLPTELGASYIWTCKLLLYWVFA